MKEELIEYLEKTWKYKVGIILISFIVAVIGEVQWVWYAELLLWVLLWIVIHVFFQWKDWVKYR